MKKRSFQAFAAAGFFFCAGLLLTSAAHDSHDKNAFAPDTIPWGPAPPVVRPGAQFAVLEGDPTASTGDFTIRLKMPDGFRIAPHWHPQRENVTIISETFKVGDTFDPSAMKAFPGGSFAFLDPDMHHFAWLTEKPSYRSTVILPCSSTTSTLAMTPARVSSRKLTAIGKHLIPFASGITARKFKKIAIEKEK